MGGKLLRYGGYLYLGSWCRGLTCLPVTEEIAGSNPVEPARNYCDATLCGVVFCYHGR
jgi:hypothetical protein